MTTFLAADDEGDALGGIRGGGGCCAGTGGLMHRGTLALPFGTMSTIIHVIVIRVLKNFKIIFQKPIPAKDGFQLRNLTTGCVVVQGEMARLHF